MYHHHSSETTINICDHASSVYSDTCHDANLLQTKAFYLAEDNVWGFGAGREPTYDYKTEVAEVRTVFGTAVPRNSSPVCLLGRGTYHQSSQEHEIRRAGIEYSVNYLGSVRHPQQREFIYYFCSIFTYVVVACTLCTYCTYCTAYCVRRTAYIARPASLGSWFLGLAWALGMSLFLPIITSDLPRAHRTPTLFWRILDVHHG